MDLRIGAIVIAILGVVEGIGAFLNAYGYGLIHLDQIDTNGFITIQNIVMCVAGGIRIIAGLCLLFGSIKYHETSTLVYLVLHMLSIVLYAISMFVLVGIVAGTALAKILIPHTVGIFCTQIIIYIYFWICVYSFYRGLKSGDVRSPV